MFRVRRVDWPRWCDNNIRRVIIATVIPRIRVTNTVIAAGAWLRAMLFGAFAAAPYEKE